MAKPCFRPGDEPQFLKDCPEPPNELESVLMFAYDVDYDADGKPFYVVDWDHCWWGGIGDAELCDPV